MATTLTELAEATFGDQLFIRSDPRNLMTCDMTGLPYRTITVPLAHAFLCRMGDCWVFVGGYDERSVARHGFSDASAAREENAAALAALGVRLLDTDAANANLREGGLPVSRVT
jgi:hypothetical protein